MGSSKKSSDKDRERDKEVRKKRRERSKERSKRKSRSRDRGHERSKSRERSRSKERRRERSKSRDRKRERSRSKERGRERSKERGRERSRSRERKQRNKSKERAPEKSRSKERRRSSKKERDKSHDRSHDKHYSKWDGSPGGSPVNNGQEEQGVEPRKGAEPRKEESTEGRAEEVQPPVAAHTHAGGDASSMSIEGTNKLRISLGLKPLQVGTPATTDGEAESVIKNEPVHAPPKNIGEIKASEKLKEKIVLRRETRKITQALSSVRTLGQEGGEEGASAWVTRMRVVGEEKRKAEKQAQMLAEMDEEFGIANLISDVVKEDRGKAYSAGALKGLKVEHDVGTFKEGRDVTLILKDTGVLDETDPVLLNVNMVEAEMAAKNVEFKKGKPGYNPYEDEEVDELGNVQKQALLSKYDEEIHGEKKKVFVLGSEGGVNTSEQREREIVKQRLMDKRISLEMPPVQIASEYYTSEEMVQFKKVKKKRKLRKKERVRAADILPLSNEEVQDIDHGSRNPAPPTHSHGDEDDAETMDIGVSIPAATDDLRDEADNDMTNALTRNRRLVEQSKSSGSESMGVAKVVDMLQRGEQDKGEEQETEAKWVGFGGHGDTIILDTTAEFCKQVGEEDKTAATTPGDADDHGSEEDHHANKEDEMDLEEEGGWMEVRENTGKKKEPQATDLYQEAEPLVASGVAATLKLATKKGFVIPEPVKKHAGNAAETTSGKRDIEYERQKEKERDRELSRYGREGTFNEKKGYVPNVKIEHIDDSGRVMSIKEAFRYMSHKFHGRTSGRKKTEKRLKKLKQEKLLTQASSVDTPLNTLAMLKSKQKSAQSPYILVSGGAQSLMAPDIAKRK